MNKNILLKPIITEKTLKLADEQNQYTFYVNKDSNKVEVEKAIEEKFTVKVLAVKMINTVGKKVSFGRKRIGGKRSDMKKAVIRLKSGDKIGLFNIK